jgi:hypothetical protein
MVLSTYVQKLLREKAGNQLSLPFQLELLAGEILASTGKSISVNTLKRLLGELPDVNTSTSTLNIIAEYLGFRDWNALEKVSENGNSQIAELDDTVFPSRLDVGTLFEITYEPRRRLLLKVGDDKRCIVEQYNGSKLAYGDVLSIAEVTVGSSLVVSVVERDGKQLGRYMGGIEGGVKSITFKHDDDVER